MKKIIIFILIIIPISILAMERHRVSRKILVGLDDRIAYVVEEEKIQGVTVGNWKIIKSEPIMGGRSKHRTPIGKFRIYWKDKDHVSSKYPKPRGGASMLNSLFLQKVYSNGRVGKKTGVAFHYSGLFGLSNPSYGCIHVSYKFSNWLYNWAKVGTKVEIYKSIRNRVLFKKKNSLSLLKKSLSF